VKRYTEAGARSRTQVARYAAEVRDGSFPGEGKSFGMKDEVLKRLLRDVVHVGNAPALSRRGDRSRRARLRFRRAAVEGGSHCCCRAPYVEAAEADWVIVLVKAYDTPARVRTARRMKPLGIVSLQNGLSSPCPGRDDRGRLAEGKRVVPVTTG
jgi:hypothetical protein